MKTPIPLCTYGSLGFSPYSPDLTQPASKSCRVQIISAPLETRGCKGRPLTSGLNDGGRHLGFDATPSDRASLDRFFQRAE